MMRKTLIAIALATLFGAAPASAQSYPSKPITMIVPFPAGGATDTLARFLGERMKTSLGQAIIIGSLAISMTGSRSVRRSNCTG